MNSKRRALLLGALGAAALTALPTGLKPLAAQEKAKNPVVVLATSVGDVTVELNAEKAPVTVKNFLAYVEKGHYNGTIFHRVIEDFMIQGGGFDADMKQKSTSAPIKNEASNGLKNQRGTLAMARTANPDSATAQFFINTVDNSTNLGPGGVDQFGYAVFGKVTKGMDVVDKIRKVATGNVGPYQNVPLTPVVIKTVTVQK